MSLTVKALSYSGWESLRTLLESLGCEELSAESIENWDSVNTLVSNQLVLVLHRRPERIIATAMAAGQTAQQAIAEWKAQAEQLLAWLKRNRRSATVVEVDALLSAPETIEKLCDWLNIRCPRHLPVLPEEVQSSLEISDLDLLLASQLMRQHEGGKELLGLLEASTLPLGESSFAEPLFNIEQLATQQEESKQALEQLHTTQEELERLSILKAELDLQLVAKEKDAASVIEQLESTRGQLKIQQENSNLLLEQLHTTQEELERQQILKAELGLQLVAKEKDAASVIEQLESTRGQLKIQQEDSNLLLEQLHTTQEELERQQILKAELGLQLVAKEKDAASVIEQLESTRGQLKIQQEESNLLLEQLHMVQEELEQTCNRQQHLEAARKDEDAVLAVANGEIAKLHNELNSIKASRFYRLLKRAETTPQRKTSTNKRKLQRNIRKLNDSPLFDANWYQMTYADVAQQKMEPARHYIKFGAAEGRDPSPHFNTSWYLQVNPDVADSGINPLIHYMEHGEAEGRAAKPEEQNHLPGPRG
ncbi:hypothetical protein ACQUQP_05990 [Marinobacterium sp. YM272]|uniref:hypothetical protein n=1 Tax=Marinobacterium sp. YM272 TaxID=3421654 RepID=UPI003D7F972E